jgi:CubicO group peptidase (beta-lactamase class C family)
MIMLDDFGRKKNSIDYMELIKYVPNFILPKRYWNLKEAIKGGDFKVAFEGREEDPIGYHNLPDWRMAQVPSANGHGTAHSLAKLYGILSNGCQRDGHQIMKPETLDYAIIPLSSGPDSVLFGSNITFGLGYELGKNSMPVGNFAPKFKNAMFGHAGVGGGVAFGDIENQLGFGFVCNQMHEVKNLYKTVNEIMDALFAELEK